MQKQKALVVAFINHCVNSSVFLSFYCALYAIAFSDHVKYNFFVIRADHPENNRAEYINLYLM